MVVLNQSGSNDPTKYDMSFMYTRRCDLRCPFCMYNCGPEVTEELDLSRLRRFLDTVDTDRIASWGAYGGEVGVALDGYSKIFDMLPLNKPTFVITNGSWSTDGDRLHDFLAFCAKYKMHIVVSGTLEHRKYQNRKVLEILKDDQPEAFRLKPLEENFHPMGRLEGAFPVKCSRKCVSWNRALRVAIQPDGNIIFQNCDGQYPIVGNIDETFSEIDCRIQDMRKAGFSPVCPYYVE